MDDGKVGARQGSTSSSKLIIHWYSSGAKELVCQLISDDPVTLSLHNNMQNFLIIVTLVTAQCHNNIIILISWKYHRIFIGLFFTAYQWQYHGILKET